MNIIQTTVMYAVLVGLSLATINATVFVVRQQTSAVIERLGKFHRTTGAGLHIKIPFVDRVVARIDLRIDQMMVKVVCLGCGEAKKALFKEPT